ncbi:MAG TPA: PQQ-binding-like beta-propeller repeat protein [Candidatus Saccharimonadales bacterium]|nr:PQQ-binding-like beta-propeller repeat protein [Candidatus Saccharimonadales bacterium]
MNVKTLVLLGLVSTAITLSAADWPQYRGPNGDGTSPENGLLKEWPSTGLKQVWKTPLPDGFSSFAVGGGKAYTLIARPVDGAPREVCVALDSETGKEAWFHAVGPAKYDGGGNEGGPQDGPRGTPTVNDGKVYILSANLFLACLDANTGKEIWTKDIKKEHSGTGIHWQNAASPLIDGDMVFVAGGGPNESMLGLDKQTGKVIWKGESETITHATPIAGTILGERQIIFFMRSGLVSVAPKTGNVLWRHPFKYSTSTAASPIIGGDTVYCSAGYGVGASAARITKEGNEWKATELWRLTGNDICNHWSTPVYHDGYLYGLFSFKKYKSGPMKCVELATGKQMWSEPGFGAGNLIFVDNHFVVLNDQGELVLVEPNPKAYKEISRAKAVNGKCWSTPVVSNGRIYARSTKEGVCLDVTAKTAQR